MMKKTVEKREVKSIVGRCSFCGAEQIVSYTAIFCGEAIVEVEKTGINFVLEDCSHETKKEKVWACPKCVEKRILISEVINQ